MDLSTLPEIIATYAAIGTSLIAAIGGWRKAIAAQAAAAQAKQDAATSAQEAAEAKRRAAAAEKAFEFFDAQNRGVVLVITYPDLPPEMDAIPWIKSNGWQVRHIGANEFSGDLPQATPKFLADVEAADVVLLQGSSAEVNARIAGAQWFKECLQPGAGVVSLVPDERTRYNLKLWRPGDQGVTAIGTAEIAVRSIVARRRMMAYHHGIAAGGLAQAKAALALG